MQIKYKTKNMYNWSYHVVLVDMSLTQLETVESELQRKKKYGQNKVLKLTGLKRRSRGHQERLKRS
jgi:hypothetical protein